MDYYGGWGWRPYVSVAERRRKAVREMEKRRKKGTPSRRSASKAAPSPRPSGARAWCENLERYSDFANRLPRGRTYVRNGSVVDLQITPGAIQALVSGSELYEVALKVAPVAEGALEIHLQGLRGRDRFAGRTAPGALFQRGDGTDLPAEPGPVSLPGRDPAFVQLPGLGRICASMSRRCSTASARGSTTSRNSSSACAEWTKRN